MIRVLHVDEDGDSVRRTADRLPRVDGRLTVRPATDLETAIERVRNGEVDCLLSAYRVRGHAGLELVELVREIHPGLPVVFYTDREPAAIVEGLLAADATDYVRKSTGDHDDVLLARRIRNVVERGRVRGGDRTQYRQLFEDAPVMMAFTREKDGEPLIEDCNQRFADKLGYPVAELRGRPLAELYTEESTRQLLDGGGYERALDGEFTPKEREFLTADGEGLSTLLQASPRLDEEGETVGTHALYVDVTARNRAREVLERAEAMEASMDGMALLAENGEYVYLNRAHAEVYGYESPEPLLGESWRRLYEDAEIERFEDEIFPTLEDDGEWRGEAIGLRADGTTFPQELSLSYLEDGSLVCTVRDVTDRVKREREIRELTDRLELAVEGANLGIWDWDVTTDEVEFNEQWADILGYDLAEIDPHVDAWKRRVHPDDRGRATAALEAHMAGETDYYESEHRMRTADGDWKWIRDIGRIVERADGEPVRAVGVHLDVDERKSYERALEDERDVFTQGPAVFFNWADETGWPVEYVSENVTDVFGYTPEQLESGEVPYATLVHEADRDRLTEEVAVKRDAGTDRFSHDPYRVVTADGEIRWVVEHTKRVRRDDGRTRYLGYLIDVTEQKTREAELQQFRRAVEETAHAIYITDRDGRIEYANPATTEITGYDAEAIVGERPGLLGSEEHDDSDYDALWDTVLSGEKWEEEIVSERKDGDRLVLDQTITPITGPDGEVRKFVAVARDVTDRKRHRDSLERDRDDLRQIIDLVPDLLFVKNRDGEYVFANEATADAYGLSPTDVEGKTDMEVLPSEEQAREFREGNLEVIDSGEPKRIPEEELTTADGETRLLQTTILPYEVTGTGEEAVLVYGRDVTELKEYERRLETQRDTLSVLNEIVRHDIRNELQLILASTESLEGHIDEDGREYVEQALNSARNAVRITDDARHVAEVTLKDVEPTSVSLPRVLETEIDEVRSTDETAVVRTRGPIPAVDVAADDMLESVFRNLLKNAIVHNDAETPEVTVSVTEKDDHVVVSVADNGPGIPDSRKDEVFEKGEMGLDSDGTGMGLYLVATLLEDYGGDVWIADRAGRSPASNRLEADDDSRGSVFNVELPLAEQPSSSSGPD